MIDTSLIPEFELKKFCYPLIETVTEFFKDENNQKEFQEWQKNKKGQA